MDDVLTGKLIVPIFVFWLALWKPSPSRWMLGLRLLFVWLIVVRLAVFDSFGFRQTWQQLLVCAVAVAMGAVLTRLCFRYYERHPVSQNSNDPDLSGRPT
jgi:membrane protein implicated in regulation of membrane protease activity